MYFESKALQLDCANPIDWLNPLNRGLVSHWQAHPQFGGGNLMHDFCFPADLSRAGVLQNMAYPFSSLTSGWGYGANRGGGGPAACELRFDGSNDFVSVADADRLSNTVFSVEASVRPATLTSGIYSLFGKRTATGTNDEYTLLLRTDGGDGAQGVGYYWRVTNSDVNGGCRYVVSPSTTNIEHLVVTYNGTTRAIYRNGDAGTTSAATAPTNGPANFTIGSNASAGGGYWNGSIYCVRYYNRVVSLEEARALRYAALQNYSPVLRELSSTVYFLPASVPTGSNFFLVM